MFGDGSLAGEHDIVIMGLLTAIGYILTIGIPLFSSCASCSTTTTAFRSEWPKGGEWR